MDDIFDYFDALPGLARQYQDTRINIALAGQQYRDVRDGRITLASLAYHWDQMPPQTRLLVIASGALVIYTLFAKD